MDRRAWQRVGPRDANFTDGTGATVFRNADSVTFNDTAATTAVTLSGSVGRAAIVVNASSNYTFTGPGGISSSSLTVQGAAPQHFTGTWPAQEVVDRCPSA